MSKFKKNTSKFGDIIEKLDIDESQTKAKKKQKVYNKFVASYYYNSLYNYYSIP